MAIVLIGQNKAFIKEIEELKICDQLIIIESNSIIKKLGVYESPIIEKRLNIEYYNNPEFLENAIIALENYEVKAVIPGFEYSVVASSELSDFFKVPGIGLEGAAIFTNKYNLREFCKKNNINSPKFRFISTCKDIEEFYNGHKIVLKPTNRQGSIGIEFINSESDIIRGFRNSQIIIDEPILSKKQLEQEFLVEDYIQGEEVSTEVLVSNGEVIFTNFTKKVGIPDQEHIEYAHYIPAELCNKIKNSIMEQVELLISSASVVTSVLHAEWKIFENKAYLIECAARMPGDFIPNGISLSYDMNFRKQYILLMCAFPTSLNSTIIKYSLIQYFSASNNGKLRSIENIELIKEYEEYIAAFQLYANIGDRVAIAKSSWDRLGYFILVGENKEKICDIRNEILSRVVFVT